MPAITLPDGSVRSFDHPVSVADVAASIGAGLAKATVAGKVNGRLVDACDLITEDASLQILTPKDEEGVPHGKDGDRSGYCGRLLLRHLV